MNEGSDSRYRIAMKPTLEKQSERLKNRRIQLSTMVSDNGESLGSAGENTGLPPPHKFNSGELRKRIER